MVIPDTTWMTASVALECGAGVMTGEEVLLDTVAEGQ